MAPYYPQNHVHHTANARKLDLLRCDGGVNWSAGWITCCLLLAAGCHSRKSNVWNPDQIPAPVAKIAAIAQSGERTLEVTPTSEVAPTATPFEQSLPKDSSSNSVSSLNRVTVASSEVASSTSNSSPTVVASAAFLVESNASPAASYALVDLEELALANNPAIRSADALSRKAAGLQNQVGMRPNPTLGYFGQQLANRGTDQQGVFYEQEFVRGNKLELNREVLRRTLSAQQWESETQRQRVLTDVRTLFYEALGAQQQLEAIRDFESVAKKGVDVAIERKNAEEGTAIEVLQSETLLSEISLAAEQAAAAFRGAWEQLAQVAGIPGAAPLPLTSDDRVQGSIQDWNATLEAMIAKSPEYAVANAIVCEKLAILRRQQAQYIPNVSTQLGTGYDNGTDSGMINVQVGAPIPVINKNHGNIAAAHADYVRAVENVKRVRLSIGSRMAKASQEIEASSAAVRRYDEEILPKAKKSLDLSEEVYRAGELDFLQVLVVRRVYFESKIKAIQARAQLAQSLAIVDGMLLSGGLEPSQDFTDGDGLRGQTFGGQ
jgi:outer membrane protein, heavy metal efflux system